MRKNKKILIISIIILLGIILSLKGIFTNRQVSNIPKENEISFIEIYDNSINNVSNSLKIESHKDISEIYNVILSAKKNKGMKSINDSPTNVNGKIIKIVLTDKNNNYTSLFAYEGDKGKYCIEKPYEGIYKISIDGYKLFTKYLNLNIKK